MKLNDVIALAKAGYTAEQIQKMATLPVEKTEKTEGPKAFTEIKNVEPERPAAIPNFDEFYKGLAKALREDNILESKQKKPETTDDILAKIINPPEVVGKKEE